jgi:RimJ/RimL family protein N-acetyltransferase
VTPSVSLRRSWQPDDLAFLSALARDPMTEPFLAPGASEPKSLRDLAAAEPPFGQYLIEVDRTRAGGLALAPAGRAGSICEISRVMVRPEARGAGVATSAVRTACRLVLVDHGLHRIETQVYEDNVAGQRLFERAGFTREGVRRGAYRRRERWLGGVYYGLLAEEL